MNTIIQKLSTELQRPIVMLQNPFSLLEVILYGPLVFDLTIGVVNFCGQVENLTALEITSVPEVPIGVIETALTVEQPLGKFAIVNRSLFLVEYAPPII